MSDDHAKKPAHTLIPHAQHPAHAEEGEGNWLVSYADMMTLLVGFFVILLSFSTVDQQKMEEAKRSITEEFGGTYKVPFAEMADRIREKLEKLGMGQDLVVKHTDEGVEISFRGTVFFASGSADIKSEAQGLVDKVIPIIKEESKEFEITIEGHTDDVPLVGNKFLKNNWDLSSLRASRVLVEFEEHGFDVRKMTAVGYGESRPVMPNRDKDGTPIPENMAANRRVLIKLLKRADTSALGTKRPDEAAAQKPDHGGTAANAPSAAQPAEPTPVSQDGAPTANLPKPTIPVEPATAPPAAPTPIKAAVPDPAKPKPSQGQTL